jgi:protein SCO1/2
MLKVLMVLLLQVSICFAGTGPGDLPKDSIYQVKSKWIDQFGKKVELSSLAGKPVVVSMIYLSCTFSCPMTVAHMKELEKMLPDHLKDEMQFVLVSFDGKNDTPAAMKKFAAKQSLTFPKWRFLTSKNDQDVRELASLIDFKYKKIGNGDFEHSFGLVALDAQGRVLGSTIGATMAEKDLIPLFGKK